MTVIIQIHFIVIESNNKIYRQGEFRIYGKKPELAAYEFWKQIRKENPMSLALEKVLLENEDITDLIRELEEQEWSKRDNDMNDLPF